jgi:hypothetical protein
MISPETSLRSEIIELTLKPTGSCALVSSTRRTLRTLNPQEMYPTTGSENGFHSIKKDKVLYC